MALAGPTDDSPAKIKELKGRLARSLRARFLVRFHVALILAAAIAVGWIADYLLLKRGLGSMAARYPAAVAAAYLGFLVGARVWIEYSGIREYINARRAEELLNPAEDAKPAPRAKKKESTWWESIDPISGLPGEDRKSTRLNSSH